MAYMRDGNGPFPNRAGEYCGNHAPNTPPTMMLGETPVMAAERNRRYLATMRFGRPHSCGAGTSKKMAERGWVGLYLREDSRLGLRSDATEIPTPSELMEPPE